MSIVEWLPWVRERRSMELEDELRAHLEMAEADRIARGESPNDAAYAARREFGNPGLVTEIARDQWAGMWLERLGQDVRFALRMLRRSPGFSTIAISTSMLGVAAVTAMFSVVDATLIHPLPYPHSEQLVRIEDNLAGIGAHDVGMSTPEWNDLQHSGVFQYVSPTWHDDNNLTGLTRPQRVSLTIVAPGYFALLGVKPQLGATFHPADRTPGFNAQAVISDGLWKRAFGGDPHVIGKVVQLDSDSYQIVGVMPAGFHAPSGTREERSTEVWPAFGFAGAPLSPRSVQSRASLFPGAIARLEPGLTIADAQRRIDALVRTLRQQFPADYPARVDWRIRLVPLKDVVVGDVRQPLLFLLGAVLVVLLIGCANIANLLLARATTRGREIAVRQALGAAPSRLTRQLLTENIVLSILGGLAAVVLLLVSWNALVRLVPDAVPRLNDITVSWRAMAVAFAIALTSGIAVALAPALGVRRLDVTRVLKDEGRGSTGSLDRKRARRVLVVGEFALSLMLLSAAGLLVRSFWTLLHAPLGFEARHVAVVHTRLPYPNDPGEDRYTTAADEARFARDVTARLRALRGVEDIALGSGGVVPLDHPQQDENLLRVLFESGAARGPEPVFVNGSEVSPGYFGVLGIPLVRGRLLNEFDTADHPSVAVVNEAMARAYWPADDAIGQRVKLSPRATEWTTIVGVVADARTESLATAAAPHVYASLYQHLGKHLAIFLRGRVEPSDVAREVRDQVQAVDASLPVFGEESLNDVVSASVAVQRFTMELIAAFALVALLLAALGIYGLISYFVTERSHEIGLRVALGAQPQDVTRLVMGQGVRLLAAGAGVGLIGAFVIARAMAGILVGVSPADPATLVAATATLTAIGLVGCYVPVRRALRVDPIVTLRSS